MTGSSPHPGAGRPAPACIWHLDRPAALPCRSCRRPICPECLQAGHVVAQLCPDCAAAAREEAVSPSPSGTRPAAARRSAARRGGSRRPVITVGFIAFCVLMYLAQLGLPRVTGLDPTQAMAYAPLFTSDISPAIPFEPWRMLTSAVLHSPSSVMHIAFNMMALWVVGRTIEPAIGPWRYTALLVLSAFGASVAVLFLSDPTTPTVGASGAVFGLFGALFILLRSSGAQTGGIVALVGINMAISFLIPNISWQGHLGGLVTGLLVALVLTRAPGGPRGAALSGRQTAGLLGVAALLVVLTVIGVPLVRVSGA